MSDFKLKSEHITMWPRWIESSIKSSAANVSNGPPKDSDAHAWQHSQLNTTQLGSTAAM